ncbi:MAG: metallophosphoesterase [archaeon]
MDPIYTFIIPIIVIFSIYFGVHYYVYSRLQKLFPKIRIKGAICILAFMPIISMMIGRSYYNIFIRIFDVISFSWIGIIFFLIPILITWELLRSQIKLDQKTWQKIILTTTIIISLTAIINGQSITVKEIDIPLSGLKEPLKIVQLSDIHLGTTHNSEFLAKIVEKTNEQNPDIIFITGDLFDGAGGTREHTIKSLDSLAAMTYFVTGNHETYIGIGKIEEILKTTNVTFLRDQSTEYKGLQIIGMDNPARDNQFSNPDLAKIEIDGTRPSILLYHQPLGMTEADESGIDLQLSGHTHNGQIFPFNLIQKRFYPMVNGLYKIGDMYLYVSPGTGTWGPPMRLGSRNEITVINLFPA